MLYLSENTSSSSRNTNKKYFKNYKELPIKLNQYRDSVALEERGFLILSKFFITISCKEQ